MEMSQNPPKLPVDEMSIRHPGLSGPVAASYQEAARVCLDRHHEPPIEFQLRDEDVFSKAKVEWRKTDERSRGAWANEIDATEAGAYCFALAATELARGLVAVRRAETKTGADYYLAAAGEEVRDLENCLRLEVSGIDKGSESFVVARLLEKLAQARRGQSNLPALAAVVGFRAQQILIKTVSPT
jgi:hypothetical protein